MLKRDIFDETIRNIKLPHIAEYFATPTSLISNKHYIKKFFGS